MPIFHFKQLGGENQTKRKAISVAQRSLEDFQPAQEKQSSEWLSSIKVIENEVNNQIRSFQHYIREIKDSSIRFEELTKMFRLGEISENIYRVLLEELSNDLSPSIEEIFRIRENLELLKARAKIEWAKEKVSISGFEMKEARKISGENVYSREIYSPVNRWQEIISKIDSALLSLTFEEELSIIERYLLITREKNISERSKNFEEAKRICQQRLNILSEKWSAVRRDKINQIMDLELKASQLRDEIKEIEVRFAVGEISKNTYESKVSVLQGSLRKMEKEISEIRGYIDEIDLKIFRISELLGKLNEKGK